jgi:uncharacterized protein with PQ loop repeat
MLLLWTQADVLSLIGSIVLNMHTSIIIIGWYHFIIGILMIICVIFYRNTEKSWFVLGFVFVNALICIILNVMIKQSYNLIGEIVGWITTAFYIIGRFPQIWLNYKNKSTHGLSVLMYIFTILGNASYIVIITINPDTIRYNMPWIVSSSTMIVLDIYIIYQHYYYTTSRSIV